MTRADHCSDETRAFWTTPPGAERLGPPHWLLLAAGPNSFCDCRTLAATGAGARALPNKLSAELQPFGEELGRSPILTPRIRVTPYPPVNWPHHREASEKLRQRL